MKRDFRDNKAHNINEITCTGIDKDPPSQYTTKRTVRKYKSYLLNVNVCNIMYSQAVTNPSTKIDGVL